MHDFVCGAVVGWQFGHYTHALADRELRVVAVTLAARWCRVSPVDHLCCCCREKNKQHVICVFDFKQSSHIAFRVSATHVASQLQQQQQQRQQLLATKPILWKNCPPPPYQQHVCRSPHTWSRALCLRIYRYCLCLRQAAELLVLGGCDAEFQEVAGDCSSLSSSTRTYDPFLVREELKEERACPPRIVLPIDPATYTVE